MARYKLIIEGDVQQIGFREHIKKEALKLKIKGSAKNLDDGSVEVYCDLSDSLLDQFKARILEYHDLEVTDIKIIRESDPEFQPSTDFKAFKVIRGEDEVAETLSVMTSTGMEMHQGIKSMHQDLKSGFANLGDKIDSMHQDLKSGFAGVSDKIDSMHQDLKSGFAGVSDKIDSMHQDLKSGFASVGDKIDTMNKDMNTRFDTLDEKYGKISEIMLKFLDKMDDHNNKLDKILERLTLPKK